MTTCVPATGDLLAELLALPPDQRLPRFLATAEPEPLLLALGDEAERLAAVEVARALAATRLVVDLADDAGSPLARARARRARAMALAYAGRFLDALPACDEAVAVADDAGLSVEAARARLASVHALSSLGRFDEAITAGEAARSALLAAGEPHLAARADLNLGAVHDMRDDPASAVSHYDRARPHLGGEPVVLAQLEANRGTALMGLDRFREAEAAFRAAVAAFERGGLVWAAAVAEANLASLATRQGRLEVALHHFERGRRFLEHDESPVHLSRLLADQADAYATLGLPEESLAAYERVLPELERHSLTAEAAHARVGLGRALLRLGRRREAESSLTTAAAAFDALGMPAARARIDLVRAELAATDGRPDEARTLVQDALDVLHDRPVDAVAGRYQLARLALAAGNLAEAERELGAALATAEALDLAPVRADLLHARGLLHRAKGAPDLALADLRAAVAEVERVRGTLQAERFRAAFLGDRLAIYETFVAQALDRGDPAAVADAFAAVERAKSRALLDLVSGALDLAGAAERETADPGEAALLADLARLQGELNWLYSRLGEDAGEQRAASTDSGWHRAVHERERELDAVQDRIAVGRGVAGLYATPVDLAGAQRLLPPDAALVEYFMAGGELLAFVVRDGSARVVRGLGDADDLADRVHRVRFQIARAVAAGAAAVAGPRAERLLADARRELRALHALVLAPLLPATGGVRRLVIVPHGPLHAVPFHALWDGERHLVETHEVQYAPSASLLNRLTATNGGARPPADALVVGMPDALAPQIATEAARVAVTLGTDRLVLGAEATVERVATAAQHAAVVHLACHGRFSPESPLASGLKLADRWLTARDVYALRLRATLVTLSGCDTGRSAVGGGDELIGLIRGFLAAGASSLLLSLWTVNDESAADLMTTFYARWRSGATKTAALRAAQLACLAERPHPAFWAPFLLGGHP